MGSYLFAAQYQQRPAPLEGGILKWDWFKTYDKAPGRIASDMVVQSWDPASSTGDDSDWSVCTTWLLRGTKCFLLDLQRFKKEFPELVKIATASAYKWQPNLVIIENIGVGRAMCQQVRRNVDSVVRGYMPKSDKEARMIGDSCILGGPSGFKGSHSCEKCNGRESVSYMDDGMKGFVVIQK